MAGTLDGHAAMLRDIREEAASTRHEIGKVALDARVMAASALLARLGYANVMVRHADGYQGWAEHAPYDGILVTAAAPHVPPPLIAQLKPGGRLVIPIGLPGHVQQLKVIEKLADGAARSRDVLMVAFVPLTGALR